MKYLFSLIGSLVFLVSAFAVDSDLTVTITNIKDVRGDIVVGIFDKKESFPNVGQQFKQVKFAVNADVVSGIISGLPDGEYGIAIFHDKNGDGVCDTNILGIPKEGFGFSNNIKPKFRAPSFKDVKFTKQGDMNMKIKLLYF